MSNVQLQEVQGGDISVTWTPTGQKSSEGGDVLLCTVNSKEQTERTPTDLVVVIDVSASMSADASVQDDQGVNECLGLTVLDIVKHSVRTMVHTLGEHDRIAIVRYSDDAKLVLPLTKMTEEGREQADEALNSLVVLGRTNLWGGLELALKTLVENPSDRNSHIYLMTDGMPNVNPPLGHLPALEKFKARNGNRLPCPISTFGFGYSLDSPLLKDIAVAADGTYSFIPDSGMVGTIFVHAASNLLSTKATECELIVSNNTTSDEASNWMVVDEKSGPKSPSTDEPSTTASQSSTPRLGLHKCVAGDFQQRTSGDDTIVRIGPILSGQSRSFYMQVDNMNDCKVALKMRKLQDGEMVPSITWGTRVEADEETSSLAMVHKYRARFVHFLTKATADAATGNVDQVMEKVEALTKQAATDLGEDYPLVKDLSGQVKEAFSRRDWFTKWGRHYLPSLCRTHQLEQCNNFKDVGVQGYGGKLFAEIRDTADDIFNSLPAPKPSGRARTTYGGGASYTPAPIDMSRFNNCYGGCFHGRSLVHMADGSRVACSEMKKGMEVQTPSGSARVNCVLKTKMSGEVMLCKVGELLATPYHPVRINGSWTFPCEVGSPQTEECDAVYTFVIDRQHVMIIDDIECICLGHGIEDDVAGHAFFGTEKVLESLAKFPTYESGLVEVHPGCFLRDEKTNLICDIVELS